MYKTLKSKILKSVKSKRINIFFLFLVLSFFILVITKLSATYTNTIIFLLKTEHVPSEEVIVSDKSHKLNITLKSQGFNLIKYYFKTPELAIDFSKNINKTDSLYIWNKSSGYTNLASQFDKNEEIINVTPDTLRFRYDVNAVKKVPVKLHTDIRFNQGYDLLDDFSVKPDSITIIGPHVIVDKINHINTDTFKLKKVKSNINSILNLKLPNTLNELKFSDKQVSLKASVSKFTEGIMKVPVIITNVPDSISVKYFPKKMALTYYTSLSNFNNIKIEDFEVVCDFSKLVKGQSYLHPEVTKIPKSVKNVKINQQQIEFIITE